MNIRTRNRTKPSRTEIFDVEGKWLATLTNHAYTVTLAGSRRAFSEPGATPTVRHAIWVRTLPAFFDGEIDVAWLKRALEANKQEVPDVLAIAMQYTKRAPKVFDGELQIAGDASYGPMKDGTREEGSDFNDYLGIEWAYPGELDKPEERQRYCLDCSGFIRMVWGYRHNLPYAAHGRVVPLCLEPRTNHGAIPRRAYQICEAGPGIIVAPDSGTQLQDFSHVRVGDLVFFDADESDGIRIDHVGMYLGLGTDGHHRFISSRKAANGPTLGDYRGKSVLDGTGLYARSFRAVRRL